MKKYGIDAMNIEELRRHFTDELTKYRNIIHAYEKHEKCTKKYHGQCVKMSKNYYQEAKGFMKYHEIKQKFRELNK